MASLLRTILISLGLLALLAIPAIMLVNSANKDSHESDVGGNKHTPPADKDVVTARSSGKGVTNEGKPGSKRNATKREAKGSSKAAILGQLDNGEQ